MQVKSIAECSPREHSAILSTFIKLPFVIKIFALSIFKIVNGHFTQVLLYFKIRQGEDRNQAYSKLFVKSSVPPFLRIKSRVS